MKHLQLNNQPVDEPWVWLEEENDTVHYMSNITEPEETDTYEYVDLDLPSGLLWASCNVGATSPEEPGMYFRWGETTGHYQNGTSVTGDPYNWVNTPFQTQNTTDDSQTKFTKYLGSTSSKYKDPSATDADALKATLDPEDDAAHANMGGDWRMPTSTEFQELYDNTTNEWTTENGVNGRKFTSKTDSSKYIFIPAAGSCNNGSVSYVGTGGFVWSSSLYTSDPYDAYGLGFRSSYVSPQGSGSRCVGRGVRGVKPKKS